MVLVTSDATYGDLVAELVRREEQVRQHDPVGVHRARVACRRLRALVKAYRLEEADELGDELRWLGQELAGARDGYVVHQLLVHMLAEEPPGLVADSARRRVERTYGGTVPVPDALDSERYVALRTALESLDPERPSGRALRKRVRTALDRVADRYDVVTDQCSDEAMHDLRKAAKRLRYTAELWSPDGGKDARRVEKATKRLTQHLGMRQDTVVTRAHLLRLTDAASAEGEPTFTYGRLHAREQARAEGLDAALPEVWRRFIGPARRSTC